MDRTTSVEDYFLKSKNVVYSILVALPLFLTYEILALVLQKIYQVPTRNGVELMLKNYLMKEITFFPFLVFIVLGSLTVWCGVYIKQHKIKLNPNYFFLILIESFFWSYIAIKTISSKLSEFVISNANLVGLNIQASSQTTLITGIDLEGISYTIEDIMLCTGAGLYEELFFRLMLISAIMLCINKFGKTLMQGRMKIASIIIIASISGIIFSLGHYYFFGNEEFEIATFIFRSVAGVILSSIYLLRGFGIAAWSHFLYDILTCYGFYS